jgi:hypothetical protein
MKSFKTFSAVVALASVFEFGASGAGAGDGLQIDKAVCGWGDSWRDVTAFLQGKIEGDTLSMRIAQPFNEFDGDPAPGKVKNLLIDFHFKGQAYRLSLKEQYPVAFTVGLPSSEAVAPGTTPLPLATRARSPSSGSDAEFLTLDWYRALLCLAFGISVVSMLCAVVALVRISQLKQALNQAPSAP